MRPSAPLLTRLIALIAVVLQSVQADHLGNCNYFGNAANCPRLQPLDLDFDEVVLQQPYFQTYHPATVVNVGVDNVCITFYPLNDGFGNYIQYQSRVYSNGYNEINSFITNSPLNGVIQSGSARCVQTFTSFSQIQENNCNQLVVYVCLLSGDCFGLAEYTGPATTTAFSTERIPLSDECWARIQSVTRSNGIPDSDYLLLPMNLPSVCVSDDQLTCQPRLTIN